MTQNEIENAPDQQDPTTGPRPEWTIMIYMAGDNNLSANSIAIMQALEDACRNDDVRVLACFDSNTPRPKGARYVLIHRPHVPGHPPTGWSLHDDLIPSAELGATSVVAPDFCNPNPSSIKLPDEPTAREGLSRFLTYALKHHPAKRYMLILFGHGSAVAGNTFLLDNNPPSFLRLKDFAEVLARHFGGTKQKLDILACDNCIMNGIESAYQIREQVKYMLGSQGLVLAVGWPYQKIIDEVVKYPYESTQCITLKMLMVCARSLLDFSLMDRSSEQAVLNLERFSDSQNIVTAVKRLSTALQEGLEFDEGELLYPEVCDAVRLARLQAQSYWDETFVDLYDFCTLLVDECNKALKQLVKLGVNILDSRKLSRDMARREQSDTNVARREESEKTWVIEVLRDSDLMKLFEEIAERCVKVINEVVKFVPRTPTPNSLPYSYYVGAELQYSHGMSIYFPWTLPEDPIIFDPVIDPHGSGSSGSYGGLPSRFDLLRGQPNDFLLKTAFDEYRDYDFPQCSASDWAAFLESFFRATLRNVRVKEVEDYTANKGEVFFNRAFTPEDNAPIVNLKKAGPDIDSELDCTCPKIKNYPRRFYISPADCLNSCPIPSDEEPPPIQTPAPGRGKTPEKPCVSYLGWNLRGLAAEVIKRPIPDHCYKQPGAIGISSESGPEAKNREGESKPDSE